MKYTYLLINFLTVFFPIVLSFDKRVQFYKNWQFVWPGMGITGAFFLGWDVLFTAENVWSFNAHYISGIKLFNLPIEEIFFFLTVPFACIFIYECINYYIKWQLSKQVAKYITATLIILSFALALVYHNKLYTLVTFSFLYLLLGGLLLLFRVIFLNRFYLTFLVSLVPFYLVNGVLTALPVVIYNNHQNMGLRVGTIPFEDHFYSMSLLLMNVGFFEFFKRRKANG